MQTDHRDVPITAYVPSETAAALRVRAAVDGRSISALVARILCGTLPVTSEADPGKVGSATRMTVRDDASSE